MHGGFLASLRGQIVAVALAPCLAFAAVTGVVVSERWSERAEMVRVERLAELTTRISAFAHEAQRERGLSSLVLSSKGAQFRAELDTQRSRTDRSIVGLADAVTAPEIRELGADETRAGQSLARDLGRIAEQRRAIGTLEPSLAQATAYYTGLIGAGLDLVRGMASVATHARIASLEASYTAFLSLKEAAGQERAVGAAAFTVGTFDLPGFTRFASLWANQTTYAALFRAGAGPEGAALLDRVEATDAARQAGEIRQQSLATPPGATLAFHDAPLWFKLASTRIDGLKEVENRLGADLVAAAAEVRLSADRSLNLWAALGAATVLLSGLLAFALGGAIARPLARMADVLVAIGRGDEDVVIPKGGPREVRAISGAAFTFQRSLAETRERERLQVEEDGTRRRHEERIRREAEGAAAEEAAALVVNSIGAALERLSAADLTAEVSRPLPQAYEKIRLDLNSAVSQLRNTMHIIAENGRGIQSGSGEISAAANDLARRTEQQAAALEETAAALDEITATVRRTAEGARHASGVVTSAQAEALGSGRIVQDTISAMTAIERSSNEISSIVGVIDEIAFQTNLLALNAGVEAARAGEAGRGFAVVASEVRALAQRSAGAAKEIKALISMSSKQVETGVDLVGQTGKALARIAAQVTELNGIVTGIAASTQEQASALQEVNTAINQMDQVTQQNAAMVEESTAASQSLARDADNLFSLIDHFHVGQGTAATPPPSRREVAAGDRRAPLPPFSDRLARAS